MNSTTHIPSMATAPSGHLPYLVAQAPRAASAKAETITTPYTGAQLAGAECAVCTRDLAYADGEQPHSVVNGGQLNACAPQCNTVSTGSPQVTVEDADLMNEAPLALYDSRTRIVLGIDFAWPASFLVPALNKVLQEAFDSGRWVRHDTKATPAETATKFIRKAVSAELDGIDTHPRTTADQLHRAIDDESARHLAKVGGHSIREARAAEAFSTAARAMEDALEFSEDREGTVLALRTALEMLTKGIK
ncbi:hypothetical protein ACFW9O_19065 [Streptomyces sp. NPDC059499]|uniref:hypothetical protein n=1 Tax=Streptomyces sp. NPDC059499 TaxID=3346852 RepID=UPI00369612C0